MAKKAASKSRVVGRREKARAPSDYGAERISASSARRFTIGGENLGRDISGVIVDFGVVRTYYDGPFNKGQNEPPACFAVGRDPDEMVPHENVPKKQRQSATCGACPKAVYGRGKPASCKERRRFVLIGDEDLKSPDTVAEADMYFLECSPKSLKHWRKYAGAGGTLENQNLYPHQVVTKFSFDEDDDNPVIIYEMGDELKPNIIKAVELRMEEAEQIALRPYDEVSAIKGDEPKDDDDDDDDADEDEEDEDEEGEDEEDEDEDEDEEDEDEEDEDEDEDEEDEDEEDEDEDEDEEDEDKPRGRKKTAASKPRSRFGNRR